jgi:MOSC domain-containing protein YiiM
MLIASVSLSPKHGFSKQPQEFIRLLEGEGVEGDAHRGRTTQHIYRMKQDPTQPNLCQVHLVAVELLQELHAKGYEVRPGELGENILTEGLDLLALPLGTLLHLGPEAIVEVTGLRTPCSQIDRYQHGLQQHLWGPRDADGKKTRRAGIMSVVRVAGTVRAGDVLRVVLPPEPYQSLPAV